MGNLPWSTTDEDLQQIFAPYEPYDCHVKTNMAGRSRGFGILRCERPVHCSMLALFFYWFMFCVFVSIFLFMCWSLSVLGFIGVYLFICVHVVVCVLIFCFLFASSSVCLFVFCSFCCFSVYLSLVCLLSFCFFLFVFLIVFVLDCTFLYHICVFCVSLNSSVPLWLLSCFYLCLFLCLVVYLSLFCRLSLSLLDCVSFCVLLCFSVFVFRNYCSSRDYICACVHKSLCFFLFGSTPPRLRFRPP